MQHKPVSLLLMKYVAVQVMACAHVTQPLGYWIQGALPWPVSSDLVFALKLGFSISPSSCHF
jgi:hypothetical protein